MSIPSHVYRVVQDQQGNLLTHPSVTVCPSGSTVPLTDAIYADEALTLPLSNPFTADSGIIDFYLTSPRSVALLIDYSGKQRSLEVDALPNAENLLANPSPAVISNSPSAGKALIAVGPQTLAWVDPPLFGGSKFMRATTTAVTSSVSPGQSDTATTMPLAPGYRLYRIQTSCPARVRLYESSAAQTADSPRAIGTDPSSNSGVILDYVTPSNAIFNLSPLVDGALIDPTTANVPMSVTNLDVAAQAITVTFTYLPTEDVQET